MPIRNFFAFGNRATPQMPSDMSQREKELLIKTSNTIFNALDAGKNETREEAIATSPVTDIRDAGMAAGDYSLYVNVFSKYIYSVERDKRTRVLIYREMSKYPEIAFAVDEYVDEAINENADGCFAELRIRNDAIRENDNQRKTLIAEFNHLMYDVINADKHVAQWFREFMIDGEIFFEKIVDIHDETRGIVKVKRLMSTRCYPIWKDIESDEILFFSYQSDDSQLLSLPREKIAYANSGKYDWSKEEDMKLCLSFLEEAKTTYKRLKLLEDALVIYRIVRAPERRVFKIDVGNLPKGRADQFMQEMIKKYRQRKFFDPASGDVSEGLDMMAMTEDFWFPVFQGGRSSEVSTLPGGCLTLDTKIPLLDGRVIPLQDIINEHNSGIQNWVYSCDPNTGEIKPGKIDNAAITKKNAHIMKLTFDNGNVIRCTPEHKFPIIGKGMTLAKDLVVNDSIIPFNTEKKKYGSGKDYEFIYDNNKKEWIPTHKMVSNAIKGTNFHKEEIYKIMISDTSYRKVVLDKRGKSISKAKSTVESKNKMSAMSKKLRKLEDYRNAIKDKQKIKCSFETFKMVVDIIKEQSNKNVTNIVKELNNNSKFTSALRNDNKHVHGSFGGLTSSNIIKLVKEHGFSGWRHFKNDYINVNHRIVSIEYLTETEDVGDLQIDNKHIIHNYHTYATEAGVFVSNSGLGEIADVEYFRNKMYQGLKIPKSRFGEDNKFSIGDTQDITREEVKFVKEVKRFTERFSEVFKNLFLTHLKLKGIADEYGVTEQDIKIHMFANNLFEKFLEAKVLELRFQNFSNFKDLIDTEKPLFSRKWVTEKFLEITEEEWKKNQELLAAEGMGGDEKEGDGVGGGMGGGDLGGSGGIGGDSGDSGDSGGDGGDGGDETAPAEDVGDAAPADDAAAL